MKDILEQTYLRHHRKGNRYGYLYCGGQRGKYLQEWIGKGKRVLDLGCRDGTLTSFFAPYNYVVGADVDRAALELLQKNLKVETCWLDLNSEWPFPPQSFDVIVACELMEHLFFLNDFLDKVQNTLKPGGLFIGSVPNAFRMRNRWKFLFGNPYENDPTHVRQFSFPMLLNLLESRFSDVEIIPIQGKILPFLPVHPKLPQSLNRLFAKDFLWKANFSSQSVEP